MAGFAEYDRYDALGLSELVKRGEVRPIEIVEEAIRRIDSLNPKLNAVIHTMYDRARELVRNGPPAGPFSGVPLLIKDLGTAVAGEPLRNGSAFFRSYVPDYDCELIVRYRRAGMALMGKTNTPEFGMDPVTEPELFGIAKNPWDLERTTGGSSGGSAAAVSSRMVPLAHGSDGGGSIRMPASCCGVFGLKPTRGRNPSGPDGSDWYGLSCAHVLTRSVRDSAAVLDATSGSDAGAIFHVPLPEQPFLRHVDKEPGRLRIAFTDKPLLGRYVHEDCRRALTDAVELLRDLGHTVEEAAPGVDKRAFAVAYFTMVCGDTAADIEKTQSKRGRRARPAEFEPLTWITRLLGREFTAAEFSSAISYLWSVGRQLAPFFETYDAFLTPTLSLPPVRHGEKNSFQVLHPFMQFVVRVLSRLNAGGLIKAVGSVEESSLKAFEYLPFTALFNASGQPAMSVPLFWNDDGLPIGVQLAGRFADEATLFSLAGQLERARPWADRIPPVCEGINT